MDEVLFVDNATKTLSRKNGPFFFKHVTKPLTGQLDFDFKINTGGVKHKVLLGNLFSYLDRKTFYGNVHDGESKLNIPIQNPILDFGARHIEENKVKEMEEIVTGFYVQDWIEITDRIKVLLGGRYDYFDGAYGDKRAFSDPKSMKKGSYGNFTYRGAISV